jgi:site-specific recombinase XerC
VWCFGRVFFRPGRKKTGLSGAALSLRPCGRAFSAPSNPSRGPVKECARHHPAFSRRETFGLLARIDPETQARDPALFELMYSSGLPVCEAARDLVEAHLRGKFGRDRVVPLSKVAAAFLGRYPGKRAASPRGHGLFGAVDEACGERAGKLFANKEAE